MHTPEASYGPKTKPLFLSLFLQNLFSFTTESSSSISHPVSTIYITNLYTFFTLVITSFFVGNIPPSPSFFPPPKRCARLYSAILFVTPEFAHHVTT